MIDGLKPYPEYKDSGVAWLGAMPGHWDVRRLKQYIRAMQKLILWLPRSSVGASPDAPASRDAYGPLERPRLHSHAERGNEKNGSIGSPGGAGNGS